MKQTLDARRRHSHPGTAQGLRNESRRGRARSRRSKRLLFRLSGTQRGGKATSIRMLMGVAPPTSGSIELLGMPPRKQSVGQGENRVGPRRVSFVRPPDRARGRARERNQSSLRCHRRRFLRCPSVSFLASAAGSVGGSATSRGSPKTLPIASATPAAVGAVSSSLTKNTPSGNTPTT
jgi:hypothetical protein